MGIVETIGFVIFLVGMRGGFFSGGKLKDRSYEDLGPTIDWIGLRENLQETIDFPIKYGAFL